MTTALAELEHRSVAAIADVRSFALELNAQDANAFATPLAMVAHRAIAPVAKVCRADPPQERRGAAVPPTQR
ncbi:MAG TPA: hypothetical protein VMF89_05985, partial [Polyangiales bacterium]|nr:hypothetical protein [Polyangiales bacterium]